MHAILGHFDFLLNFKGFSYLEHISFITNNLPHMCLILNLGAFVTLL